MMLMAAAKAVVSSSTPSSSERQKQLTAMPQVRSEKQAANKLETKFEPETAIGREAANLLLLNCKGSNSSNETVIAACDLNSNSNQSEKKVSLEVDIRTNRPGDDRNLNLNRENSLNLSHNKEIDELTEEQANDSNKTGTRRGKFFKNLHLFTNYLKNPFNYQANLATASFSPMKTRKGSESDSNQQADQAKQSEASKQSAPNSHHSNFLLNFALRYVRRSQATGNFATESQSAPVSPVKWPASAELIGVVSKKQDSQLNNGFLNPYPGGELTSESEVVQQQKPLNKPSVRFVEADKLASIGGQVEYTDCASQTMGDHQEDEESGDCVVDKDQADLVSKLFELPAGGNEAEGESPMNSDKFRKYGYRLIDYISNYLDTIDKRRVTPLNIEPGYLKSLIQPNAPEKGESFANIMRDFENHIMCGITHWQHPHFHAYFPAGNAYPSILADMLSDALGCVGFSWAASPAYTELEIIMLDWMGKMIGLPDEFLCLASSSSPDENAGENVQNSPKRSATGNATASGGGSSKGGGVIQGSASECVLVNMLAARHWAIEKLRQKYPGQSDGQLVSKLIGYCSKEAHSCVEKAAMIGFIRMRALETDDKNSLRGAQVSAAIKEDLAIGLEPFLICATLGTTSCVSFDNLDELGDLAIAYDLWLHVDAAYAGSALICPEFQYLMKGIEKATSFNMNPNKWMLINFDCSLMWVKDRFRLTRAFVVDPLYLQHSYSDQAIDYRHWGIPLSRRFRSLKLWFVIRNYGLSGLQAYIRNHVELAKLFESLILNDKRFSINNQVILGLVCFRLIGSNSLNQRLLSMINASGKLHMVPASLNGRYVIRFCICDQNAKVEDVHYAYKCISEFATELLDSIRSGRERIRAISEQNTIDISNISLHTQQSASSERLSASAEPGGASSASHVATDGAASASEPATTTQQRTAPSGSPVREMARQYLLSRKNDSFKQRRPSPQISKQTSAVGTLKELQQQQEVNLDDFELQEAKLDSLATIDGYEDDDDDLYDDDLEPPSFLQEHQVADSSGASQSTLSRANLKQQSTTTTHEEGEDETDEVFNLNKRKKRMSLRYKREFFVRVVSDPRVYRASISGDINARASSSSLSGAGNQGNQAQQANGVPDASGGGKSNSGETTCNAR